MDRKKISVNGETEWVYTMTHTELHNMLEKSYWIATVFSVASLIVGACAGYHMGRKDEKKSTNSVIYKITTQEMPAIKQVSEKQR